MKVVLSVFLIAAPAAFAAGPEFPQPVQVGALVGQKLIGPEESQPLLGRVEGVEKRADGMLSLRVRRWSLLPWGGRTIDVPVEMVSLLGPQVALTGLSAAQLDALPDAGAARPVAAETMIQVGLVKPFH